MSDTTLFFAYDALLDPDILSGMAPGARFQFTAHYPETRLGFAPGSGDRPVPTLVKDSGHTVWGAVFEITTDEAKLIVSQARNEGRIAGYDHKAVDREGNKHDCLTLVASENPDGDSHPSPDYVESMIRGARHWSLPAGWIMGLQDLAEDSLSA